MIEAKSNYGWSDREGAYRHLPNGTILDGIAPLEANDASSGYAYPVAQYGHSGQRGVTFVKLVLTGGPVANVDGDLVYSYNEFVTTGDIYYSRIADIKASVTTGDPSALAVAQTYRAIITFNHDNDATTASLEQQNMAEILRLRPCTTIQAESIRD